MADYHSWALDINNKSIASGYYTYRLGGSCRIRFKNVMHLMAPVVSERGTVFRWRMTQQLKDVFEYFSTAFVNDQIAPQYNVVFGKPLGIDVIDDSFTYLRTKGIYLRIAEPINSMTTLNPKAMYTIDLELRSVGMKEARIQLDWKLIQVSEDINQFVPINDNVEFCDEDEDEDVAEPSASEYIEVLESTKLEMTTYVENLTQQISKLQVTVDHVQEMIDSLNKNIDPRDFSRVHERWSDILER
jgi:hypothetical protein